jgi:arylsulfatase A-like enzyme
VLASVTFVGAGWSAATDPGIASGFAAGLRGPGLTRLTAKITSLASDWDGDGVGALLGESDCAPTDPKIFPGAVDIPGNGIDENCSGADTAAWRVVSDDGLAFETSPALQDMNIVLITIDTLRSDHTGFGGYGRPTTPNLDRLAAASATFTHLEANSAGTRSAFPSIFTGLPFYEQILCAGDVYPPKGGWHACTLHPEWPTLGERLASAGFQTAAVVSHRYLEGWGLERGFQTFQAASQAQVDRDMKSGEDVTALAVQELERLRAQRFFLWVHYFEPHRNYVRHEAGPQFGEEPVDLYDAEIAKTDSYIGLLLRLLANTHLDSQTIVIVTSDHGEEFVAEHGGTDHTWALYDTSTKLPLIVHVPGGQAFRHDAPVSQLDILPTILHLAGARKSIPPLEGRTLAPSILTARPPPAQRPVFATIDYPRSQTSVSVGKHKLIVDHGGAPPMLYDRSRDPLNQNDIAGDHPEITAQLRELLEAWRFHAVSRGAELRRGAVR